MTVTLSPIGDLLAVEHWSTRIAVALKPDMGPDDVRRAILMPMRSICDNSTNQLHAHIKPEHYVTGASSMAKVPPLVAETVFGVSVPGRPGPEDLVPVDLPEVKTEATMGQTRVVRKRAALVAPVRRRWVAEPVMEDVERAMVIALTHFRLLAAGHDGLALRAASADYREDIVVTADGRTGEVLWWVGQADIAGVRVPTVKKLTGRFSMKGDLIIEPRRKQVS